MPKLFLVLVLAVLLVVAFSVPALAGASDPPNAWGQHRADTNWLLRGGDPVEIDGDMVNNWGHDILPYIKALGEEMGLNWGQSVAFLKILWSDPE